MGTMGMGGGCRGCSRALAAARSPLWGGWGLANGGTPAPSKAGTQGGCRTGRGQRCCARAVRDAWLQQVPGSQRGWAARERCQPSALCLPSPGSALPPSSQPLRASPPPARPRPCSCRRFVSFGTRLSAFVPPSAPAPTSPGTRRASAQPSPRQRRGKAQAAAGYLPTASPGASRNGAPGNGDAGGEQRPQLPAAAWCVGMKRDLPGEGTAGTGSRDGGDVSPGSTAGGRAVGRGGTSMGDIVPVAQRAPLASKPNLQSVALSHSSPDTLQGAVPRARALPAAPPAPQQDVAALGSPPPARSRF